MIFKAKLTLETVITQIQFENSFLHLIFLARIATITDNSSHGWQNFLSTSSYTPYKLMNYSSTT